MKKLLLSLFIICIISSTSFAVDFSPIVLELSAAPAIQYDFDGSTLEIPVTVKGTPASMLFLVHTKDQGKAIGTVRNGFLGWHYVNKIDTCIYVSEPYQFDIGSNTIKWNGKDSDGNSVPKGEYTYYMFAYDNVGGKTKVHDTILMRECQQIIQEMDEKGMPLTRPFLLDAEYKWIIGNDPFAETLLETTSVPWPEDINRMEGPALQPDNFDYFFVGFTGPGSGPTNMGICKFQWVPNGESVLQTDWADDGKIILGNQSSHTGVVSDNNYLYMCEPHEVTDPVSSVFIVDFDGELLTNIDLSEWWTNTDDFEAGGQMNGGPWQISARNNYVFFCSHGSCLRQMIDGAAGLENEEDLILWSNGNGDIIGDHNFEEDAAKPWVCFDFNVAPYGYNIEADDNLFNMFPSFDVGAVSFGLLAPDGTGIGYFAFAGETAGWKAGNKFVDYDSAFDGMYMDNQSSDNADDKSGIWYIAHDSINGVISSKVAVDEAAPDAFVVAQNSPNPFNPSTTISFNNDEASNVSIVVFNVAGQKVDTIANEFMGAGRHSVTWDASGFSAGVYFYTVKSGDFSKTMKMTLLK